MVLRLHEDLTLNLRKASVAAPELRVLTEENGRLITNFYNGDDIERDLYEDEEKIATVTVTKSRNGVLVKGLVGPKHRIQPVPVSAKSEVVLIPHEIHEIEQQEFLDKAVRYRQTVQGAPSERDSLTGAEIPNTVHVEVFVVLDRAHHRHFQDTMHALWYLCVTINAANLRFRATSNPRVKLLLTGIERSEKEPYIVYSRKEYLFDDATLLKFRDYALERKDQYGYPDLVYLMTGLDVSTYQDGRFTAGGLGIGYVAGVCSSNFVALGEDKAWEFSGMHTLTHEIAHILGAVHDGEGPDVNVPGHPGAANCPWRRGNIMSYVNKGAAHQQFSKCTLQQIGHVMRRAGEVCWQVVSKGRILRGVYPGMAVTFREFCSSFANSRKNSTFDYVTVEQDTCKVRCYFYRYEKESILSEAANQRISFSFKKEALDYMPCGEHEVCIQSVCVKRPAYVDE
ncbi:venom metalloproteinase antarease-like TtrivMP_A [Amblyomma americanum]